MYSIKEIEIFTYAMLEHYEEKYINGFSWRCIHLDGEMETASYNIYDSSGKFIRKYHSGAYETAEFTKHEG